MHTVYEYIWYLLIYACLGWCAEVAFAAVKTGKFVNRGFLNGPVCPIYGFGVCLVVFCLGPVQGNLVLLFLGAVVLTSAIEYATGYVLEKVYHEHWWDYSKRPLNIKGYICLQFSLVWGAACVAVLRLIHPMIRYAVNWMPIGIGVVLAAAFLSALLIDFVSTVVDLHRFNKAMRMAAAVTSKLRGLSDDMGESISSGVLSAVRKKEEVQVELLAYRSEREEQYLQDKADLLLDLHALLARSEASRQRLLKAFPNLRRSPSHMKLEEFKAVIRDRIAARRK